MKFDKLNLDCLESVLECLQLTDLLNAADTTKRLKKAAQLVYDRKYGNKIVMFEDVRIYPDRLYRIEGHKLAIVPTLVIGDFKTALQLLRCVGCNVTQLDIQTVYPMLVSELEIEGQLQRDSRLFTYVNDYCAEHLTRIMLRTSKWYPNILLEHFNKPLLNVRVFFHQDYKFTKNVPLNRIFPNLEEIRSIHDHDSSFFSVNTTHFPHLKKFVVLDNVFSESPLQHEMITAFLQLNPQIISLRFNLNFDLIRNSIEYLQNIENLMLNINSRSIIMDSDDIIRMKHVKSFTIHFIRLEVLPERFPPFAFEHLERLIIWFPKGGFVTSFHEEFFNFIENHPKISFLRILNIRSGENVDWSRLASALPLLDTIEFFDCSFSTDKVIGLVPEFRMLNKFKFILNGDYNSLRKRLGYIWEGTFDTATQLVQLKRRP